MPSLRTGDQNLIKEINKSIVFHMIKRKSPISRAQISKKTGLNKATVSTMVSELMEESFVYEIGTGQSSGGRKPVLLEFNHRAGFSIGIDLGVNYLLVLLTDLKNNIVEKIYKKLDTTEINFVLKEIYSSIELLIKKAPKSPYGIIGIGVGVPGYVDENEKLLFAPNLKWKDVDLKKKIEHRFHLPTTIINEANAGAHGEHLYGAGKNISNLVYVSVGIGIGTGIIINNQLFKGFTGLSGEMGHFTIDFNGTECSCGNRGCWELYASEHALLKAASQHKILEKNLIDPLEFLFDEAQKGNTEVLKILNSLGKYLGIGITNIINTLDPEVIIIGNHISKFKNWIIKPIENILQERVSIYRKSSPKISFSLLNNDSIALGANAFAISHFFLDKKLNHQMNSIYS